MKKREGYIGLNWIKWNNVYKSKEEGGLGMVKSCFALKVGMEDEAIWRDILVYRYGNLQMLKRI